MSRELNNSGNGMSRREFIKYNSLIAAGAMIGGCKAMKDNSSQNELALMPNNFLGGLQEASGAELINGATWYSAASYNDGLEFRFAKGTLAKHKYLTSDMLYDGKDLAVFNVTLQEGAGGDEFQMRFGVIPQCSIRMRMPLSLTDMNTWRIPREGAWLKPTTDGVRVDLEKVDRMKLVVIRKNNDPVRWCMTPMTVTDSEIEKIDKPLLPKGKLLDELGQYTLKEWKGKSKSVEEVAKRLKGQLADADKLKWPSEFSKWGGWKKKRFEASGFFGKHFDGNRWWLVDPDGYAYWSAGLNCVRLDTSAEVAGLEDALTWKPDRDGEYAPMYRRNEGSNNINYLTGNLIRAFGKDWRKNWEKITLSQMRGLGFNTVANWSEWEFVSKAGFPYVRPMSFGPKKTKLIYRDLPDVFDADFESDAEDYSQKLKSTVNDPALIGYFMMNEPTWGFSEEIPAAAVLANSFESATRKEMGRFIQKRYGNDAAFAAAWQVDAKINDVATGKWKHKFNAKALEDLEAFTEIMIDKFFTTLQKACKKVDKNHMNLGVRYYTIPPKWALKGMRSFDVFSMNNYKEKVPAETLKEIHEKLNVPTLIGEYHFGALDAGLPASGIGCVRTQADRGKAYRVYVEGAAANPYCVGTHWFTLYDQSALGRFDGENYNIGFYDVCNRQHAICDAARESHRAMYELATGARKPFNDKPEYIDKLFL